MDYAYRIDALCEDLLVNQRTYDDSFLFATHVIERLLENKMVDLLLLSPYANFSIVMNKLDSLIGVQSRTFKTICAHEELFERFIHAFCSMVKRSIMLETHHFNETAYGYFLNSCMENLLPTSDQKLNSVKNSSDWFAMSPQSGNLINSPLKLLRPEVVAASFASEFTYVPSFRNFYPKLYQFIDLLVKSLTSLDSWPTYLQIVTLKHILEHYYRFLVAETNDRDFKSFKMRLLNKPPYFNRLYDFMRRMLEDWPLDNSYVTLIEIWRFLVCPKELFTDESKLRQFIQSSVYYVDLIEMIIVRVLEADLLRFTISYVMEFFITELFSDYFARIMEDFDVPIRDYLTVVYDRIQTVCEEEKAKRAMQPKSETTFWKWFHSLFVGIEAPGSPYALSRLDKYLTSVKNRLNQLGVQSDTLLNASNLSQYSASSRDDFSTPTEIPDHAIDRRTKLMHLTPPGRTQVLNKRAQFDFRRCAKEISHLYPSKKPWQNGVLLKVLNRLALTHNNTRLARYLRYNRSSSLTARLLAKVFLREAIAPKYVPVFSRTIARTHYYFDLSLFASYPFWFFGVLFIWTIVCQFIE